MHRFRLCAMIVALLSVTSVSAGVLMSGSAKGQNSDGASVNEPAAAAPMTALGPDGKPVRVIPLSPSDRSGDTVAAPAQPLGQAYATLQQQPAATKPSAVKETHVADVAAAPVPAKPVAHRAARTHRALERIAAAPEKMRAASARSQLSIVGGLF